MKRGTSQSTGWFFRSFNDSNLFSRIFIDSNLFSGSSRNAECSNCKHLLDKITVLEKTVEMYKNPEHHTLNSAALLHEVYNDMEKLDLE
uniref:Uncharacterized protein n=1 Tax=Tanacetum cinerariifolium TaxID=118510 RepID=A0A6L2KPD6_TANCI|nr:hypothetical protein [Tanacetum cinerariifolium]